MEKKLSAEAFPPGEYIREEAEERGWKPSDLADILGVGRAEVSNLLSGRTSISPETAKALGDAFGTGAEVWLNLLAAYQLATSEKADDAVSKRAKLYGKAPIREMQNRGWLEDSNNIEILEAQFCRFFDIKNSDEKIQLHNFARKSDDYGRVTNPQLAWLARARNLSKKLVKIPKYNPAKFQSLLNELSVLKSEPESVTLIPDLLSNYGIRFLVIQHLPETKIDGACFWLDKDSPVIVVSLRYDRIDYFWFTLSHELMHIKNRDGLKNLLVETALVGEDAQPDEDKPEKEKKADKLARQFLIDQNNLRRFIVKKEPFFSKKAIIFFAKENKVHPAIVVGQLHHIGKIPYRNFRPMLVGIKDIITRVALTDGWGNIVAV